MRSSLLCLGMLLAATAPAHALEVATVAGVEGEAVLRRAESDEYLALQKGDRLASGDFIGTDVESEVTLTLRGGASVRLLELSQIRLTEELLAADSSRLEVFLRTGTVETSAPPETLIRTDFAVKTPWATSSIRGTEFRVTHLEGYGTNVEYDSGRGLTTGPLGRRLRQVRGQIARTDAPRQPLAGTVEETLRLSGPPPSHHGRPPRDRHPRHHRRPHPGPPGDPAAPPRLRVTSAGAEVGPRFRVNVTRVP